MGVIGVGSYVSVKIPDRQTASVGELQQDVEALGLLANSMVIFDPHSGFSVREDDDSYLLIRPEDIFGTFE